MSEGDWPYASRTDLLRDQSYWSQKLVTKELVMELRDLFSAWIVGGAVGLAGLIALMIAM